MSQTATPTSDRPPELPAGLRTRLAAEDVPPVVEEVLTPAERAELTSRIKHLLKEKDATLVAHYYVASAIQELAEATGGYVSDSLDMARFGTECSSSTLVVAGVRFMGETAKILNPEKRVLVPSSEAECSLDLGCPAEAFSSFCDAHPDRTVVVYANTSAAVKARADWVATSGIALDLVRHLARRGEKILWAPDKHLGAWVRDETGADMLLWPGACVVHEGFKAATIRDLQVRNPDAQLLVHPESPAEVIAMADAVGSTTGLIAAAKRLPAMKFIVATDHGIFHKMSEAAPGKQFIEAPSIGRGATCVSCAHCPWMAMNGLRGIAQVLETGANEILIPEEIRAKAVLPIRRLLDFARAKKAQVLGNNDA